MFIHKFKYTVKILLKNKMLLFWTFAFPILLGTFFKMAFSDIENNEILDIIDIAIVDNDEFKSNEIYQEVFKTLSDENDEDHLFDIVYTTEEKAENLLENGEISGYLILKNGTPDVVIQANGINETIFNQVVEEIESQSTILKTIVEIRMNKHEAFDYQQIYQNIEKSLNDEINIKNISNKNLSYTMIEFYSLIAMACLYGNMFSRTALLNELADMTSIGKRNSITPISKIKMILGSLSASYFVQLIGIALLYLYTIFVLNVDYGTQFFLIILLSLAGSLAGLALGIGVTCLIKGSENLKLGISLAITMTGSFLAGMMGITMKYVVDTHLPILNKINPVNMITDGLYSLYYYNTLDRFYFNLFSLIVFSVIVISISIVQVRRMKYDSV